MTVRTATIDATKVGWGSDPLKVVNQYLPGNYTATRDGDVITITGSDNAGWTLDGYVIPRLASGMIYTTEVTSTTRRYDTIELNVCFDCVQLIANGGGDAVDPSWCPSEHNEVRPSSRDYCGGTCEEAARNHARSIDQGWPSDEGWMVHLGSSECEWCGDEAREADDYNGDPCEPWFSGSPCDACGSRLGGNRDHAVAMRETTEDQYELRDNLQFDIDDAADDDDGDAWEAAYDNESWRRFREYRY